MRGRKGGAENLGSWGQERNGGKKDERWDMVKGVGGVGGFVRGKTEKNSAGFFFSWHSS